jgi:hypothetical protein
MFLWSYPCAFAITFVSSIHSIAKGGLKEDYLVRFDNGRAAFLDYKKIAIIDSIEMSHKESHLVKVKLDSKNFITTVSLRNSSQKDVTQILREPFKPTIVKNTNAALKIFKTMRRDYSRSGECFNRAHIWTVEAKQKADLNLPKIFMFFTESYIRRYKFHWWFHVTPMVYVGSLKSPRTLDRRYTSGPRQTKTWSNTFVKSKRTCKIVNKFDDFFLNQKKQDCYHIYTSMYYYVPRDIEKRDLTGIEKEEFLEKEIKKAYKNGFKKVQL